MNRESAAVYTLETLGYTYNGGEAWRPPRGPSAEPLLDRIDELAAALTAIVAWDGPLELTAPELGGLIKAMWRGREVLKKSSVSPPPHT